MDPEHGKFRFKEILNILIEFGNGENLDCRGIVQDSALMSDKIYYVNFMMVFDCFSQHHFFQLGVESDQDNL